jgi:predicted ATPase
MPPRILSRVVDPSAGERILTPDQRLRVFVSSTLEELAEERSAVRRAIENLRLIPVMFELGARPHPPQELYRSYLRQSHVFVGIYHESYGWVAPGESVSGLEDELRLSAGLPRLLYVKRSVTGEVEPALRAMLDRVRQEADVSYRRFDDAAELGELVEQDLAVLLSERFVGSGPLAPVGEPPPVPMTATIGRDPDVAAVVGFIDSGVRLVTVTGPGGMGKSRLALEVARVVAGRFGDGVVFVPLETVSDPTRVLRVIAARLRLSDDGARPVLDVLVAHLSPRRLLLVIDNMEQVAVAAPDLGALLARCPGVAALVTSRQALQIRGEQEWPLTSLDTGAGVELFVQRARAAHPSFDLTDVGREATERMVELLDGMPLAIELAAANTRVLQPRALLDQLEHGLGRLSTRAADLPPRHRTLWSTLDWSYQLLEEPEQALYARMSVFAGGATLEAVEGVCGDADVPDVAATLLSLVEKSLIGVDADRFTMLHTMRVHAAELLDARGETDRAADRHAAWFVDLVEPADVLRHNDAIRHWPAIEAESENLRSTADRAIATADAALMTALARRLWTWLWCISGVGDLREATERSLAAIPENTPPVDRGFLFFLAAYASELTGGFTEAEEHIGVALDCYQVAEDDDLPPLVAAARLVRSTLRMSLATPGDEHSDAEIDLDLDEAVRTAEELGNDWLIGYSYSHRGVRRAMCGDTVGARADHERSLVAARALGHEILTGHAAGQLAVVELLDGHLEAAAVRLREQVESLRRLPNLEGLGNALDTAAALALRQGFPDVAGRAAAEAAALRDRTRLAPWPMMDQLHDTTLRAAVDAAGAAPSTGDPWLAVDAALAAVAAP